jgi:hypothetical protein
VGRLITIALQHGIPASVLRDEFDGIESLAAVAIRGGAGMEEN